MAFLIEIPTCLMPAEAFFKEPFVVRLRRIKISGFHPDGIGAAAGKELSKENILAVFLHFCSVFRQ